jgi:hypothetical protein
MEPFFMACDTKLPKQVQFALTGIHRMITSEAVSASAAVNLVNCLWNLMENSVEELKVLQTVTLLVSTSDVLQSESLAKAIAICFRLNFTKNQTTNNAASATVRQIVAVVFERVIKSQDAHTEAEQTRTSFNFEELKQGSRFPPKSLKSPAVDAFMLFQDLIQLVNAEQPFWLLGLTEMTRTFGLELLEMILSSFPDVFFKYPEFSFLLKEKICPLIIKLFSPSLKHPVPISSPATSPSANAQPLAPALSSPDKPFYPISIRLLRIINVLIQKYHLLLVTESEIFMALLIKFLDSERPEWQRVVAVEVMHKLCLHSSLIKSFIQHYDMRPHSSKIVRDMIVALAIFVQSHFIPSSGNAGFLSHFMGTASQAPNQSNGQASSSQSGAQHVRENSIPAFSIRNISIPLAFHVKPGQAKSQYLDQLDKLDVPTITEGYGLTTAYHCLCELSRAIVKIIDGNAALIDCQPAPATSGPGSAIRANAGPIPKPSASIRLQPSSSIDPEIRILNETLLLSSWTGLVASLSLLLEASNDEAVTNTILRIMEVMIGLHGMYGLRRSQSSFTLALCRSALPIGYHLPALVDQIPNRSEHANPDANSNKDVDDEWVSESSLQQILSKNASVLHHFAQQTPISAGNLSPGVQESADLRQQVVAVGTSLPTLQSNVPAATPGPVMLTVKNLHSMRAILSVAQNYGSVLDDGWYPILLTLQHLVWILGLKPNAGGSLKATTRSGIEGSVMTSSHAISTSAMSDLPVLSAMLSRLFTSSL